MAKICPECKSNLFHDDEIRQEIVCRNCGLVLVCPPCTLYVGAGFVLGTLERKFRIRFLDKSVILSFSFTLKD